PTPGSQPFVYTGTPQWFTVPSGVSAIAVDVSGAQGGNATFGGLGARVYATVAVSPGDVLQVNVGGQGAQPTAGFNGGGVGWGTSFGGGGASDLRKNGATLADRIVLAAGGGGAADGASTTSGAGGAGGAPNGTAGVGPYCGPGQGATTTAGGAGGTGYNPGGAGSSGQGGNGGGDGHPGGGGGGGYFGGGGGG